MESEAILAAQSDDAPRVRQIVHELLPNERRMLYRACEVLQEAIDAEERP
jgi:hypothetical protein